MQLGLDETQSLLQETVQAFLERELPFDRVRALERSGGWDEALWRELARQGWLALPFGERLGGGGGSLVDAGLLAEALARRAAIVPIHEVLCAGRALERHGGEAGEALSRAALAGDALPVPALAEPGRRLAEPALAFEGGALTGAKTCVDYGPFATHHLVSARVGGETRLCLVDARGPGVRCEPLRSLGRTPVAALRYERAPARPLGGPEALPELLRTGRALAAVQCVGAMEAALEATVRYAKDRVQFGRPIGTFQAVRHHAANMAQRVAAARLLAFEALSALDAGSASDAQVALAKASASRAAPEVLLLAHQIHGGNGVIEENDLYFFTLRGKERSLAWGSAEECLAEAAERVSDPIDWF